MPSAPNAKPSAVLVCGMGRLGQQCVTLLHELGVPTHALDSDGRRTWDNPAAAGAPASFTVGDCRRPSILRQAHIHECRAILLTTGDERVNIGAALAARSICPAIRVVLRSSQENLTELLAKSLGNFAAFDAAQLPAPAFSLAALNDETVGLFDLDGQHFRVVETEVTSTHPWRGHRRLHEINTMKRRLMCLGDRGFHDWDPDALAAEGDSLTCVEFSELMQLTSAGASENHGANPSSTRLRPGNLRRSLTALWTASSHAQRAAAASATALFLLFGLCAVLYHQQFAGQISLRDSLNIALVLTLAGYTNVFSSLRQPFLIPVWLQLFSLALTLAGTVATGVLYAFLTGRVLSARFQFRRRVDLPKQAHIVVIGLGRLGQRVAKLLMVLKQPIVGVNADDLPAGALADMPFVSGSLRAAMSKVNLAKARSVMVLTDDDVANLELALMAGQANPNCTLVIRTDDPRFAENVAALVPRARALGVYVLSAEAFAAAALGENILGLLRLRARTILVTEYRVDPLDTLQGLLIAEVAYGYGVLPLLHRRPSADREFFPSDDIRLAPGDRLAVLADIDALQKIEYGRLAERNATVTVHRALAHQARFDGARTLARIARCPLAQAQELMESLPAPVPSPLYLPQALRLVKELGKVGIEADLDQPS